MKQCIKCVHHDCIICNQSNEDHLYWKPISMRPLTDDEKTMLLTDVTNLASARIAIKACAGLPDSEYWDMVDKILKNVMSYTNTEADNG